VTLFYSGIFGAAVALDVSSKRKRTSERDNQIEAVKAEVEALRIQEARLMDQLLRRRKPLLSSAHTLQKRQYTTASPATVPPTVERFEPRLSQDFEGGEDDALPTPDEPALDQVERESRKWAPVPDEMDVSSTAKPPVDRGRALQVLAMKQLALRLLLRPGIAHTYSGVPMDHEIDPTVPDVDVGQLLDATRAVQRRINELWHTRHPESAEWSDIVKAITVEDHIRLRDERRALEAQLRDIFALYRENKLSFRELLLRVADNLTASEEPILPTTLTLLLKEFSWPGYKDIVHMVINTLFPAGFLLTSHTISTTIDFYARTRDLANFNRLLQRLQEVDNGMKRPPWRLVRVGQVEIPVPSGPPHPLVATSLIKAALYLEQPHKADAWYRYFQKDGWRGNAAVLQAYLRYYSFSKDWNGGVIYLYKTARYLMFTGTPYDPGVAERLILFMMILCNCCGKGEMLQAMVDCAVASDVSVKLCARRGDKWEGATSTFDMWQAADKAARHRHRDGPTGRETTYNTFARKIHDILADEVRACGGVAARGLGRMELTLQDLDGEINDVRYMLYDLKSSTAVRDRQPQKTMDTLMNRLTLRTDEDGPRNSREPTLHAQKTDSFPIKW
jgi:hypothetical protein